MTIQIRSVAMACLLALVTGCDEKTEKQATGREAVTPSEPPPAWLYAERGDLDAIRSRGKLRLLMTRKHTADRLPRGDFPLDHEQRLATGFASSLGLEPVEVYVDRHDQLLEWLAAGKGDLVVANLTVTPERRQRVAFSVPLEMIREQVVARKQDASIKAPGDLAGRKIAVRRSSAYYGTLKKLAAEVEGIQIVEVDERLDTERILARVADGTTDLSVADSSIVEAARRYLPGIEPVLDLTDERPVAWAVRREAAGLLAALNTYLADSKLIGQRETVYREDLPGLKKRGVLRVLTRNSATTYFLYRGELFGFEYDLVREFAKRQGLEVEIIVPPAREDLLPWLKAGRGDLVAAALTVTQQRKQAGVTFSRPYQYATETVVGRADEPAMEEPKALAGRTLVIRPHSAYRTTLEKLKAGGIDLKIAFAPPEEETEQIIAKVAAGTYDLTVADSHILDIELTYRNDVKGLLGLGEPVAHGWAIHPQNKQLLAAVDAFIGKEYRGLFYNVTRNKYFKNKRRMQRQASGRSSKTGRLSPYDDLVRRFAGRFDFDWRLIVSQMFAESRFDPKAKSWVGAKGLMQVMPRTAREMGLTRLEKPEVGIHAGVKYLDWTRARFEQDLNPHTRNWFALAAYNAGLGHVSDARQLARKQGLDPDRWFGNVERAMLLLAKPKHARQARYGYCRGSEPVAYVRDIRERWRAYQRVAPK